MQTDHNQIVEKLRRFYPSFELPLVEAIASQAILKTFNTGDVLMKPGQYFKSTMLVTSGRVKVSKESGDGLEFFMYYLEPGSACALSILCAARYEQSELLAKAVEETEVILIPVQLLNQLMSGYQGWHLFVMDTYRKRFEEILTLIDHTVFKGLDERLEFYLKKQRDSLKSDELKMTHEEIATDLGTSRVVISRLLKQMEIDGKLKLNRNAIDLSRLPV